VGTLFVVATPIGNREDLTFRARRVLGEVSLIAAEDTRHTARLLTHYGITTPTTSYFEHNKLAKLDQILGALAGGDVALVSDAGMPGLSDPGYELVRAALERGFPVVPVPGPSALVAALVVSGLPTDSFLYLGFLPRKPAERRRLLAEVSGERRTLAAFEAPHRLLEALTDARSLLGDRQCAVARELTKIFEEVYRGTLAEAVARFEQAEPRGEITLIIAGAPAETAPRWDEARVRAELARLLAGGLDRAAAARQVAAQSGWARRDVYALREEP
jgi:16S rRNA (cytidine1402-2'-O)-methyltransferase